MPSRSIIFCGTPEFSCPSLQALHDDPAFEVKLVITQPDKPVGRKGEITASPIKELATDLGLSVLQPENVSQTPHTLSEVFDFLVVVAYGQLLSEELLNLPKIAPVNLHFSLLPRWRGASPVQNSLLSGESETGVTIIRMTKKVDVGPILAQEKTAIDPRETKDSLTEKLAKQGTDLLVRTLKEPLNETPQDESKATLCKKLTRSVGHVDPKKMTAEEIDRHVRALVPWPGVRMTFSSSESHFDSTQHKLHGESRSYDIKLIKTSLETHADALAISCKEDSTLYVLKIQSPGKNVVTGAELGRNKKR